MDGLRILLAEDESMVALSLKTQLENLGYQVIAIARHGREAVELARTLRPDLVVMDIKMPEMDGVEASRQIGKAYFCPIILVTAFSDEELIERASEAGVLAYLVKPVDERDLAPAIHLALSRFQELQSLRREVQNLEEALVTRKLIDRAKGILMDRMGLSENEAFHRIQRQSRDLRVPMKQVALSIIQAAQMSST